MSRNITILVIILIIILISGYLVWLRQKFQVASQTQAVVTPIPRIPTPTPTLIPTPTIASLSGTPKPTVSPKLTISPKVTPKPATSSGRSVTR